MCSELPSDYLFSLCEEMKPAVHGGRYVTGDEFADFVQRLKTAIALAKDVEEDKRNLERQQRLQSGRQIGLVGDNIVPFRPHPQGGARP